MLSANDRNQTDQAPFFPLVFFWSAGQSLMLQPLLQIRSPPLSPPPFIGCRNNKATARGFGLSAPWYVQSPQSDPDTFRSVTTLPLPLPLLG